MTPSDAVEMPRHLSLSAQSSSVSSPAGTPPATAAPGTTSQPRSPLPSNIALPSPSLPSNAPLPSPSSSSTNRFGLALNFMQRRPRGFTNPSSMTPGGGRSPGAAASPNGELPPSPSGGERSGGYGFPALRRTLSKRGNAAGATSPNEQSTSRSRTRRSSSQPPPPVGMQTEPPPTGRNRTVTGDTISNNVSASASASSVNNPAGTESMTETPADVNAAGSSSAAAETPATGQTYRLRLVPHLESSRSLHFEPVDRDVPAHLTMRVGRFTDRSHHTNSTSDPSRIAFKSKVVSRGHAEIWADEAGKFFIKDTKSSSGTFLNHIRLSAPNTESRAFPLKDGDVLQLGVDYQGGTEEIYRCVKMRVELNRGWQRGNNAFNTAALAQLRALGSHADSSAATPGVAPVAAKKATGPVASVTDCCICLYPVTVCQALFIAPCSHVTHFKCIRPLIEVNYPGFCCPLCRTYADMEADVEIEPWEPEATTDETPAAVVADETQAQEPAEADDELMPSVEEAEEPSSRPSSRPASVRRSRPASLAHAHSQDEVPVPVSSPSLSGLSRSRPGSLRNEPSSSHASPTQAPPPLPTTGNGNSNTISAQTQADIYASLASAATPPNSTFLSTLADGRLPRLQALAYHQQHQQHQHPVSLDMALAGEAGPSTTTIDTTTNGGLADRNSFGSSGDEETDGPREEGSGEDGEDGVAAGSAAMEGKGKGKRRADADGGQSRAPSATSTTDDNGKSTAGKSTTVDNAMDVDEQQAASEVMSS